MTDSAEEAVIPAAVASSTAVDTTPALRVHTAALKSSYCNVCNVNTTREEVVLNFGLNHDWERTKSGDVELLHRIILSPQGAKQVATLLTRVLQDYQSRYGTLG